MLRSRAMSPLAYTALIDPLLKGAHRAVVEHVPVRARVLDACCGPGALSRRLAGDGREVLGVDLDTSLIAFARERARRRSIQGLSYEEGDVTALKQADGSFDVCVITMGLHALPRAVRRAAIAELRRVGRRVVIVDYAVPLPRNPAGGLARAIEWRAGGEHFAGFRDYVRRGGLDDLVDGDGSGRQRLALGVLELVVL
ncbi:MAG: class I SAM-dependent methyltransferase [Deltaproteobacteria bacterium]|nr:class I SAM-dependent methyltransferase [Deltaproteobacteria bacterium]